MATPDRAAFDWHPEVRLPLKVAIYAVFPDLLK